MGDTEQTLPADSDPRGDDPLVRTETHLPKHAADNGLPLAEQTDVKERNDRLVA